jgi:hypothetical protein
VTGVTISQAGSYSALPANDVAVTGGNGTGAEFTLDWGIASVAVTEPGTGYTEATATVADGAGGELEVTLTPKVKTMSEDGERYGVYWNSLKWVSF